MNNLLKTLFCISINFLAYSMEQFYPELEPEFASYVSKNKFGYCLKALNDLGNGICVGSKKCIPINGKFIASHDSEEYRHVAFMGFDKDGNEIWGRVKGKYAYVNHSCDPTCELINDKVYTIKSIKKDEELTIAYDEFIENLPWDNDWNFECKCEAINCRKYINSYKK